MLDRKINPGKVFDLTLPLDQVAEGYRAMDERRAIKTLLRPDPHRHSIPPSALLPVSMYMDQVLRRLQSQRT